jgi:hypothetical protein
MSSPNEIDSPRRRASDTPLVSTSDITSNAPSVVVSNKRVRYRGSIEIAAMPPNDPSRLFSRRVRVIAQRPLTRPSTGSEIKSLCVSDWRWVWKKPRSRMLVGANSVSDSTTSPRSLVTPMKVMDGSSPKAGATSRRTGMRAPPCSYWSLIRSR